MFADSSPLSSAVQIPVTNLPYQYGVDVVRWLTEVEALLESPWALAAMAVVVFADSYTVLLPGETFVTALGAIAANTGSPPLWAVVLIAGLSAFVADVSLYELGKRVGLDRWKWMRMPRIVRMLTWASERMHRRSGSFVFVARFIPYARIAVNLTAGATHVPRRRFLGIVSMAALGWAAYQALIGAVVGQLIPGGPIVAVGVSIAIALAIGYLIDRLLERAASEH